MQLKPYKSLPVAKKKNVETVVIMKGYLLIIQIEALMLQMSKHSWEKGMLKLLLKISLLL